MHLERTGGMTAIGILNIIGGAIGSLMALLLILGGGLLAMGGAAMESNADADTAGAGTLVAAGGGFFMLIGVVGLACWATLAIGGIGVLKLAPWGRTLSMVCGTVLCLLNLLAVTMGNSNLLNFVFMGYGAALVALFMQPQWRAAFAKSQDIAGSVSAQNDNYRAAA